MLERIYKYRWKVQTDGSTRFWIDILKQRKKKQIRNKEEIANPKTNANPKARSPNLIANPKANESPTHNCQPKHPKKKICGRKKSIRE